MTDPESRLPATEGDTPATPGQDVPAIVDSQLAFRGHLFEVRVDTLRMPGGHTATRDVVNHPGAVVVAAVDEHGQVVMVTQYRHAVTRRLLELPAGTLERSEAPLAAAQRELEEETGLRAREWQHLGSFFSSPGFLREELHAFLARGLTRTAQALEEDEDIVLEWRSLEDLLADPARVQDAKSLATLLLVRSRLRAKGDDDQAKKE